MFLTIIYTLLVLISCVSAEKECDKTFLNDLEVINYGTNRNFKYYNWQAFQYFERKVKFLHIENKNIPQICRNALPPRIDELVLIDVNLEYIEPGALVDNTVQNVVIEGNHLKTITRGVFGRTNISSLILNDNKIEQIEGRAFEDMFMLEAVSLNDNRIQVWDASWFENAKVLYEVSITHNLLEELPEDATRNVRNQYKTYSSCILYGSLNFDNNKIKDIHPKAFSNLNHFGSISLSNNQLINLPDIFKGFQYLFSLYMNTNIFECFSNDTLQSFKGVKRLYLAGNRLQEDCVEDLKSYFSDKTDLLFL